MSRPLATWSDMALVPAELFCHEVTLPSGIRYFLSDLAPPGGTRKTRLQRPVFCTAWISLGRPVLYFLEAFSAPSVMTMIRKLVFWSLAPFTLSSWSMQVPTPSSSAVVPEGRKSLSFQRGILWAGVAT